MMVRRIHPVCDLLPGRPIVLSEVNNGWPFTQTNGRQRKMSNIEHSEHREEVR